MQSKGFLLTMIEEPLERAKMLWSEDYRINLFGQKYFLLPPYTILSQI